MRVVLPLDMKGLKGKVSSEFIKIVGTKERIEFFDTYTTEGLSKKLIEIPRDRKRIMDHAYNVFSN